MPRATGYGKGTDSPPRSMTEDGTLTGTHNEDLPLDTISGGNARELATHKPMAMPDEGYGNTCGCPAKKFMGGK